MKFQIRAARLQLAEAELKEKEVLDVVGGTGVLSFLALEKGAAKVTCGDISQYMLDRSRVKAEKIGYNPDQISFRQLDAENLPFALQT